MDTTTTDLSQTLQALPPRLRAELLRHLRCADAVRAEERERYRPDPVMAAWVELLDELETGGPLMREAVRDTLEISYGEQRMRSPGRGASSLIVGQDAQQAPNPQGRWARGRDSPDGRGGASCPHHSVTLHVDSTPAAGLARCPSRDIDRCPAWISKFPNSLAYSAQRGPPRRDRERGLCRS